MLVVRVHPAKAVAQWVECTTKMAGFYSFDGSNPSPKCFKDIYQSKVHAAGLLYQYRKEKANLPNCLKGQDTAGKHKQIRRDVCSGMSMLMKRDNKGKEDYFLKGKGL